MNSIHSQASIPARLGVALLLTAAADLFLFDQPVGLSLFLFGGLLAAAIVGVHPLALGDRALIAKAGVAVAGLTPLLENVSGLSISIAVLCLSIFALAASRRLQAGLLRTGRQLFIFLVAAPLRLPRDVFRLRRAAKRRGRAGIRFATVAVWVMPIVLGSVFLLLFGIANPVIAYWMSMIDFWVLLDLLDIWRIIFWILVMAGAWAFLRPRLPKLFRVSKPRLAATLPAINSGTVATLEQIIFSRAAILRALLLFNVLFAAQTILDGAYLWGGVALPDGMTYASYAHRGAYPLIVTALLAAAFVLITMRPGSETSADRLIRALVYLWTAQNIVLVISSILRLDLYVSIYSLTYWRVAAFIWMGLVAVGLVLIMARIALRKSNGWLCAANLLTLLATLYACCFVNFAAMIAAYNVAHSREMNGGGRNLDIVYLRTLGPAILPAIDRYISEAAAPYAGLATDLHRQRAFFVAQHEERMVNWRAWTFRKWRLSRYLRENPFPPARLSSGRFED
jgi:hypothetical protein